MIARFATVSLRAERKAARVRRPLWARDRASMNAHDKLIARAPRPVSDRGSAAGGIGAISFSHAVHSVAIGDQQDPSERHFQASAPACTPSERKGDQQIDRRILEEIDAIRKERD